MQLMSSPNGGERHYSKRTIGNALEIPAASKEAAGIDG
jgi:hypothetical protein